MTLTTELLSYKILRTDLREPFVRRVKDPLRKALVLIGGRIPTLTRQNVRFKNTLTLMNIADKFFELEEEGPRKEMFRAAFKIFLIEIEHDVYYRDRFGWFVEQLIKAILRGDFEERTNGQPRLNWKEEGRYGGKYSIIKAIQKKEILKALEEVQAW